MVSHRDCVKSGVFSGPYFPTFGLNTERYTVFSPNAGKYGPEKSSYLDTFYAVRSSKKVRDYMVRSQLYPLNPFVLSAPFLYLLKTSLPPENIRKP